MQHRALHVTLKIVLERLDWRLRSQMTTLISWHVRPGILRETSSELLSLTELRNDGKLLKLMALKLLNVQEASLEQDNIAQFL